MSASDDCCFNGAAHLGQSTGSIEQIDGVATYVTHKPDNAPSDAAILFLPDVFGITLLNNQLLADELAARCGVQVFIPDYLNGDPRPGSIENPPPASFNVNAWKAAHTDAQTRPPLNAVIRALNARGFSRLAATGYCFGGRYTIDLALENVIEAAAITHPSQLKVPLDFEALLATSTVPLLINSCETDPHFPPEAQAVTDELLGAGKYQPGYKRTFWEGCSHGFATKGDLSDPKVKAGKEGALSATVGWLVEKFL
ncbi:alpha/beta-hydrolase [Mycena pura]|uniref:Alpha/beta-hydrolase n=1 Tax=Mycena pura TaxID=153505 RepID=A0AAD6YGQ0_9AGAR|nr:alpha/beta-hydrolase [Mycena pura]